MLFFLELWFRKKDAPLGRVSMRFFKSPSVPPGQIIYSSKPHRLSKTDLNKPCRRLWHRFSLSGSRGAAPPAQGHKRSCDSKFEKGLRFPNETPDWKARSSCVRFLVSLCCRPF